MERIVHIVIMKRISVLCLMIFALYRISVAQNNDSDKISVAGLVMGNTYTEKQIARLVDKPDSVMRMRAINDYDAKMELYFVKESEFILCENARLFSVYVRNPEYPVQGKIRVGDSVDEVKNIGGWHDDLMADGMYLGELRWVPTKDLGKSRYAATFLYNSKRIITLIRVGPNSYIKYYIKSSEK